MKVIELEGAHNVRDLGGTPVFGGRAVKYGLFYRGESLHAITEADQQTIFGQLGITTVIDLRIGWECEAKPDCIPAGVTRLFIPYYDLAEVGIEYNEPMEGTTACGHDFACNPLHFYQSLSSDLVVAQMRKGIHSIFERTCKGEPVYEHCSGGKDRAGVMAALILYILGASKESIFADYEYTNVARDANIQPIFERFLRITNGDEAFAWEITNAHRALPENLQAFYDAIEEKYGSLESFMHEQLGVSEELRAAWRAACTVACTNSNPIPQK